MTLRNVTDMWLDLFGGAALGPGLILGARTGFIEPIPYGTLPCSALIQRGRGLFFPQLGVPNFDDSPRRPYLL